MTPRDHSRRHGSLAWKLVFVLFVLVANPSPVVGQSEGDDADYEVLVEGASGVARFAVGCSRVELKFTGNLYFRVPGQSKRPLLNATYTFNNGWDDHEGGELRSAEDGAFDVAVPVWDHFYSKKRVAGRARVTVSAPGCKSRTFKVRRNWKPKVIVLSCPARRS